MSSNDMPSSPVDDLHLQLLAAAELLKLNDVLTILPRTYNEWSIVLETFVPTLQKGE